MSDRPSIPLPINPREPAPEGSRFARAHHVLLYLVLTVLTVWLLSGFYQVRADQVGIVERLGQYLPGEVDQGLHYHLPWPIDRVHVISTQQTMTLHVTAFNTPPSEYADFKSMLLRQQDAQPIEVINAIFDPYLITADKGVVHMEISIIYRIADPGAWLNTVSHEGDEGVANDMRDALFQQLAQRAMIGQVARMSFQDLLFTKRAELPLLMNNAMQNSLAIPDPTDPTHTKAIDLGVQVQKVDISELRVPDVVKDAYTAVTRAQSEKQIAIDRAQGDADSVRTRAEGERDTLILQARTYSNTTIQGAQGESDRFREILAQYKNAPDLTRYNLFIDAVGSILANNKRIYYAQPGQKTMIVIDPPQYDPGQVQPRSGG